MLKDLTFFHPWVLIGLLLLPFLLWFLGRRGPVPSISVPSLRGLEELGRIPRRARGRWARLFLLLPLTLAIVALARPRVPRGSLPDPNKGIDIMLTLDFSRSMAEPDFHKERARITRRQALVEVVSGFVKKRINDRIGIVCFARNPYLISPLTLDHEWALESLRQTDLMTGTGIGEAIVASLRYLKKDSDRSRVIILVTDGDNSSGRRPFEVAPFAAREKVKIYSVLIGPEIVTPSAAANHELNRVSRLTGGQFFQAVDTRGLESIYNLIDQLERKELIQKRYVTWRELHPWLITTALCFWLGHFLWTEVLRRRIP
ncbi:MAG: VWA domain-containing protein [Pedosphaera sp.]|nr:VWA domain-containing protein [Pedosphaera sp.]